MKESDRELIVTVDESDNILGREEKWKCHHKGGILHRAFMVMVFNNKKELLLARRSSEKSLWPLYWDGTIASHNRENESYEEAAKARMRFELGVATENLKYLSKFHYRVKYDDEGSENEICAILIAEGIEENDIAVNKDEISEIKFADPARLKKMRKLTPWLIIALKHYETGGQASERREKFTRI